MPKTKDIITFYLGKEKVLLEMVFIEGNGKDIQDFYIGKYPVTQAQWMAVMGNNPSVFQGDEERPVESVSWDDISEKGGFLDNLNNDKDLVEQKRQLLTDDKGGRQLLPLDKGGRGDWLFQLPHESYWEYAAKGGENHKYVGSDDLYEVGWYDANSHNETKPVGLKKPNAYGLYDMSGNVWEWCENWYGSKKEWKVVRGGSWYDYELNCTVAGRITWGPLSRSNDYGFRLALQFK